MTTTPPGWSRIKALFDACADAPAADRPALIDAAALDSAARAELDSLLAHHDAARTSPSGVRPFMAERAAAQVHPGGAAHAGQRLGAWQVVRNIGSGGMGEVFEARRADGSYEGRAAVKLLKRGMDSAAVLQRFALERQALARLSHPHIARLLDAGASDDGLPYFVLEYVDGVPIDVAARGLPLPARLRLFLQLADAVAHAHRNLLVHRDLKPGNVLVDHEGQVKLLDFGIAKALDPLEDKAGGEHTIGGVRPFTPHYASPEQVRGEPVTTATDIYSLGVLLYQMLTGTRPTGRHATTAAEAARSVLEDEPERPSTLPADHTLDPAWLQTRRKLQGDLDNIVLKALEKSAERRYASVDALAADVQHHLAGRPVSARPATAVYVLGKFVRRNRWPVLAGVLGSVGLATGLAAALLQGREAAALGVVGLAGGLGLALLQGRQAALARDLAQTRLTETRAIVSDVMVRHADAIHMLPGGLTLKAQLLETMIGHLDRLARQARDDAAFAGELAMAYARLADLQGDNHVLSLNRVPASDANAVEALALFERGEAAHAGNAMFAMWWARAWRVRAHAARARGELAAAVGFMQGMAGAAQRGLQRHPDNGLLLAELGSAHIGRGQLHFAMGVPSLNQPQAALAAFDEAEALYRQLLQRYTPAGSETELAPTRHQLGTLEGARMLVCMTLGHEAEALQHGLRAVEWRRANVSALPDNTAMRGSLAQEANNLSWVLSSTAQAPQLALEMAQLCADSFAALARDDPGNSAWAQTAVRNSLHLARALGGLGRHAEALPLLHALLRADWLPASAGGPRRVAWAQLELACCLHALGQPEPAAAQAAAAQQALAQALEAAPADADGWLLLARAQRLLHDVAAAAGQPHWRAQHAHALAQAVRHGPPSPPQLQRAAWV